MLTGVSTAWRPEIAGLLAELQPCFTEVVAENIDPDRVPAELSALVTAGVEVIPHGVTLSLAGASEPDGARLARLAALAEGFGASLVSEHLAFVRAGAPGGDSPHARVLEAGHLMPAPRTRESLDVLVDNVRYALDALPVPLAVENIAALFTWPEDEFDEPAYLTELCSRTPVSLVFDVANLYAAALARGIDPVAEIERYPLERIAYVHVGGGRFAADGLYLDSHSDPVVDEVLDLLREWRMVQMRRTGPHLPGVLLERDENVTHEYVASDMLRVTKAIARPA
ncbi:DUF692 family protein [Tsukamurella sp. 8F]|uniref:multinuclear nonheme iron-dependent oxidase n=1 Tax=unclassified Tsukamurella TaxID=2633480 RepID=UPI0023BA1F07|nr:MULTISPECIES: DUF692 family multinuclear iron-containing protein [unclassified Tsukamurella]MDF0530069.1 DUF692 family protein [Tsukamurella sp. 8J]MDF0586387.1 DUF692 family protein [Tsukamurella sp. 8F]